MYTPNDTRRDEVCEHNERVPRMCILDHASRSREAHASASQHVLVMGLSNCKKARALVLLDLIKRSYLQA